MGIRALIRQLTKWRPAVIRSRQLQKGGMISNFSFVVDEGSKEHYRKFFKSGFYKGKLTIGEIASKDIYNSTI